MAFNAAVSTILPTVPLLDDTNWFTWNKKMKMFFLGVGAVEIATGTTPPTEDKAKAEYNRLNSQLTAFIYSKISDPYQYLVEDLDTASTCWTALKGHFEKSTMGHRMASCREFYNVSHDPSLSISQYVQAVTAARAKLAAFGCKIEDTEFIDVLLMNIHKSYHHVRASILMEKTEPDLAQIKSMLAGSANATETISVKQEPLSPVLGFRAGALLGRTGRIGGSGQVGALGNPIRPGCIDSKGYTWGDVTNMSGCHRCGRSGHIAACCMYTMPDHVKDWIMSSGTRSRSSSPPPHARFATAAQAAAAHFLYDGDDNDPSQRQSPILL